MLVKENFESLLISQTRKYQPQKVITQIVTNINLLLFILRLECNKGPIFNLNDKALEIFNRLLLFSRPKRNYIGFM